MRGNSAGWRRLRWLNHWQKLKYNRVRKLRVNRAKILNGSVWTKYPVKFFSQLEIRPVSYERSTWLQANTLSICNVSTNWHIVRAKRSKCIMQKWGLHEALPKRQFKNIMVFFEAAIEIYLNFKEDVIAWKHHPRADLQWQISPVETHSLANAWG